MTRKLKLTLAAASGALFVTIGACSAQSSSDDRGTEIDAAADSSGDSAANRDAAAAADSGGITDASREADADADSDAAVEAGCFIAGNEYASGAANPTNDCQSCQPAVSPSMFSAWHDGTACGDAGICHGGACSDGCEIGSSYYAASTANPTNACQTCEPSVSRTAWSPLADGTSCGGGETCAAAVCGSECDIGGSVVASMATNVSNVCQSCQPGTSTSAWTTTNGPNAQCPAGDVCSGTCQPGCWIDGAFYTSGAVANNGCEVCQPATSTTSWTLVAGAASCSSGQVCNAAGACAPGCSVGGTYYASGATASNGCEACTPSSSTSSLTNVSGVGTCSAGEACNAGSCASGCSIGGTFYGSGATIANGCESCAPASSTTSWSNATDGLSCTASQVCVAGACGTVTAVTVPFAPLNPALPHPVISGRATTLKGIALNSTTPQVRWDFGDGTSSTPPGTFTSFGDPNNLGVAHTYTGSIGQLFIATLTVKDTSAFSSATYAVQIADPNASPDPRLGIAVDSALWYLHTRGVRGTYVAGAPGYGQPYMYFSDTTSTCAAVEGFERHGSTLRLPITVDPYSEDLRSLTSFVFANLAYETVPAASDGNGNGIGLQAGTLSSGVDNLAWGACGPAIGRADPTYIAPVGTAHVYAQPVSTLIQDLADLIVFNQNNATSSSQGGGWGYSSTGPYGSSWGDQTIYAVLALAGYEKAGAVVPNTVKTSLASWLTWSRDPGTTPTSCGAWDLEIGFPSAPDNWSTAAGLFEQHYAGLAVSNEAIGDLYANWDAPTDRCHSRTGSEQYLLANALRAIGVARVGATTCNDTFISGKSFPWFAVEPGDAYTALATSLLAKQYSDGHWTDDNTGGSGCESISDVQATAWGATTLLGDSAGVQAKICNCNIPFYGVNQSMVFDGSCSTVLDASDTNLSYAWDYNYNGSTFVQSVDSSALPVAGVTVTDPNGFSTYTQDSSGVSTGVTHPVALQVTDGRGNTSLSVCNTIISPAPHCPIPDIGGGASHIYHGYLNMPVQLDATASRAPDGDPLTYAWDFEDLNVFTDSTSTTPTHTWTSNGTYPIELQVTAHPSGLAACTVTTQGMVTIGN